ncbi:MAG: glycosyltransferase family 4 protein [Actinobacteria bacterium]|nr:glycosyltransferase family 4 protein [Actinomycetota bacterium]
MRIIYVVPHFAPDVAPTGALATQLVAEWATRGHTIEVITSFPWYREHRIEAGYEGRLVRHEDTPWGRISRLHPFPTTDKQNLSRRALSFGGFSAMATAVGLKGPDADVVVAMSPPLTLGLTGWAIAKARRARFVFNVQDIFPDVAVEIGAIRNKLVIRGAAALEKLCYRAADAVTVLSQDLARNVRAKSPDAGKVHVIPNFVDTTAIQPSDKDNRYRREFGLIGKTVVMYAGNVGLSQSLDVVLEAAAALSYEEDLVFVINGHGANRETLEAKARGLDNIRFIDFQPAERLPEVLAAADVHLIPLRSGLASSSFPSKTYAILAAGRPVIASIDQGTEIAEVIDRAGAGVTTPPDDAEALTKAIRRMLDSLAEAEAMGANGRAYVERYVSPAAVAEAYEGLFRRLQT